MNKTAIKNFAIWARNKLISDIQFRAQLLGVLSDRICEPLPQSDGQTQFFDIGTKDYVTVKGGDVSRREAFVEALRAKARRTDYATAYKTIIEKVAYTWFNRLIAIRFMEVNDYLPGRVRVLSSTLEGKAEPDLVSNPFEGGLTFTEQEQDTILRFKDENRLDELFRMLFIMECQSLSEILPGLFVKKEKSLQPRDYYPGQVFTVSRGKSGMIGVFRLESQMLPGNGKFDRTGIGSDRDARESSSTAFNFLKANGNRISGSISTTTKDYIINYQDLQGIGVTGKLALPSLIALCSIALGRPTLGSLAVLGEISISGTIMKVDELANTLQCCLDSGAKKVLIPSVSMMDFATVPADLMGAFQLIPYSSAEDAVFKALGVE